MRPAALALAAALAATLACTSSDTPSCPGNLVATFTFDGTLVHQGDLGELDPDSDLPDCTPDPDQTDPTPPILYKKSVTFDAKLAADPSTSAAALCRANGIVYSGERTGTSHYEVEADAGSAVPCSDAVCTATLRVVIEGDVTLDGGGVPQSFTGSLVEVLTEDRGVCDACLPSVPVADPPLRACAGRYALTGTPR